MTTITRAPLESTRPGSGWAGAGIATLVLLAATWWAAGSGQGEPVEPSHDTPATVEHIGHGDFSWVTLTPDAARRVGLEVAAVPEGAEPVTVPYSAVVHAADGTTWVYGTEDEDSLRFRRYPVEVRAVAGDRAMLSEAPPPGTFVAGVGSALLHGSEFEVGH
ncbi:hypothetical protein [uncultured Nocardioides sp.]|uniref:hypothetical protein n=1 Tax=uncultured Nocardioides sp. TaxID=198441 RepID=UPI0025E1804E|nr:hypothetical protein [uncultured Nocardioides sp.]